MKYYVYIYKNPITFDPFYVGKGCGNRAYSHLEKAKNIRKGSRESLCIVECRRLLKDGFEPIIEIIINNLTESEALIIERQFISSFGRRNNNTGILTNMTDGGESFDGLVRTKLHYERIVESRKGYKHSEQTKQKLRKPKTFTEESHQAFIEKCVERSNKPEAKQRVSEFFSGKSINDEHKQKISQSMKERISSGEISVQHLHRVGADHPYAKTWTLLSPANEQIEVIALKEFCRANNINYSSLRNTLNRKTPISRAEGKGWMILSVT